ncbi:MAG: prenyltransferase [Coriobacteriales bacterium]
MSVEPEYNKLTVLMCARLAAPHTWPGPSVLTTVFGGVYAASQGYAFDPLVWCVLLLCAVAAQAAVNTLNDWADYRAGTDTAENSDDPTDAVLVYDHPNPRHVLNLGVFYMLVALAAGLAATVWSGSALPLLVGALGAVFVVCYSSGKLPISYLPLGEAVSGIVMGGLIPLADIIIFAARANGSGLLDFGIMTPLGWANAIIATAPFVLGVGLIMATQNCCDIERDEPVGRKTAAVLLGRERFCLAYRACTVLWVAAMLHLVFWGFGASALWPALVCLLLGAGTLRTVLTTPLTHELRGPSMGAVNKANLFVNGAFVLTVMVSLAPALQL